MVKHSRGVSRLGVRGGFYVAYGPGVGRHLVFGVCSFASGRWGLGQRVRILNYGFTEVADAWRKRVEWAQFLDYVAPSAPHPGASMQYRGTSLIRNSALMGPYSRTLHRPLWWPQGIGLFHITRARRNPRPSTPVRGGSDVAQDPGVGRHLQGYLAHKKQRPCGV